MASKRKPRKGHWGRRAKAPPLKQPSPWNKVTPGYQERCDAAKREASAGRSLERKLVQVLGRASWVGDLLEECGFGKG